jgi:hypothetical protein
MSDIFFKGTNMLDDLVSKLKERLMNKDGNIDDDKLLEWLIESGDLDMDDDVKIKLKSIVRKRKIDKINKK